MKPIDNRYERQTALAEIGTGGQARLARTRALIVGMGGLGCPVATYLAAAGIGSLRLVDNDTVSTANLQRQVLYAEAEVGAPKTVCAARCLRDLRADLDVEACQERLTAANADRLVEGCDLVLDGTDNVRSRYIIDSTCARARIPFIYGAVRGFEGQVSVFHAGDRPRAYRELYPPEEGWADVPADLRVVGPVTAVVGGVQASEALKVLLRFGQPLTGRLWTIDLRTMQTNLLNF